MNEVKDEVQKKSRVIGGFVVLVGFAILFAGVLFKSTRERAERAERARVWVMVEAEGARAAAIARQHDPRRVAEVEAVTAEATAAEITKLEKEVAAVPSTDAYKNLRIYTRLNEIAPGNTNFASKKREYEAKVAARARYADHPEEALKITDFNWSKGGFGSIMIIDRLVVQNDASFPIKDFVIKCTHQAHSGTVMDFNSRLVYEIVPAGKTKLFREINMGFIHSQVASG